MRTWARATLETELAAVRRGMLAETVVWVPFAALQSFLEQVAHLGLSATVIDSVPDALLDGADWQCTLGSDLREYMVYGLVVSARAADDVRNRWHVPDPDSALLDAGYPACCARTWTTLRQNGWSDPLAVWLGDERDGPLLSLAAFAALGLGPLRHAPCSPACVAACAAATRFSALAREIGFGREADLWDAMSEYTMHATFRSGIVEVTAEEFRFAYESVGRVAKHKAPKAPAMKRWYAAPALTRFDDDTTDSGFANEFARRSRWSTVVWEQAALLARVQGAAIHLDCGDGLLLELIALVRPTRGLVGIDARSAHLAAASKRLTGMNARLVTADWAAWPRMLSTLTERAGVVILDAQRVADATPEFRRDLFAQITAVDACAVVVATDQALARFGNMRGFADASGLRLAHGRTERVSAVVEGF
ncbi:hypothetical protein WK43_09515 [Burkholderia ubonensis]|nr:hypothetical protein WK38_03470 [Burkholderia ubonensis]KVS78780.1 hypothetical protein WK42_16130 [Burkholderia ubonensis]KVS93419.1 hypothetical protein WK44_11015 [Burkholderia ubonensis]KVS94164.1 hypothetical protein WK43_09515 [Burkholderia ubonensis]KVS99544.1 hypothetical protein WK45_06705 [Burkholderia ubonensis]